MKKKNFLRLLVLVMLLCLNTVQGSCTNCIGCSHTTFVPRTMAQNSVLELSLTNYFDYNRQECNDCPSWLTLEVDPYYFKSTNDHALARYFLPNCKNSILIGENNTSDVSSPWLELITPPGNTYLSRYSIAPTRRVVGGAVKLFFDLSSYFEPSCWYSNVWASIFVPIQNVRHNLRVDETPLLAAVGDLPGISNAIEALDNPGFLYSKLSPHALKKTGVDDINVKLGIDFIDRECERAGLYGLLFIPTGRGFNDEYLFEPTVGTKHVGAGIGFNAEKIMLSNETSNITGMIDARYAYFFKHNELRSFDLYNGDWSRYLLVVSPSNPGLPQFGVNYLTREVGVTPKSMLEIWAAASLNYCKWHLEVGYDFWYRSKEKITLADQDFGVGIADIGFDVATSCPVTAHCAQICASIPSEAGGPVSDATFITIKNSNEISKLDGCPANTECCNTVTTTEQCSYINLNSAAAPRALSNTIYAAVSRDVCFCGSAAMIGIGGSYEIASRKGTLSQYGIWLKSALSF